MPQPQSSFIGRERELVEIPQLLCARRLLTLTGPGGCGKTRLALACAADLASHFAGRVGFVDLATLAGWARADGLDAALIQRLEWAHTARELYLELGPHHPLMGLVAARAIDRLQEWAPGVRCGVLLAGYAGEPAVTFGALFGARKP